LQPILRFFTGQARNQSRVTLYFAIATSGYRILKRVMAPRQRRTLLRFEVKPGEVYELRGVRRGQ
jgi:hypothetical protein